MSVCYLFMKKTLIVGGSSGIGNALAVQLSKDGHQLQIWSRRKPDGLNENVIHHTFDVLSDAPFPELNDGLDNLVYCPGSIRLKPFKSLKDDDFLADFNINVMGAVRVIRHALPVLQNSGNASVVLFSTVAVQTGMPYHASIAAAKGALEGLVRSLAAELAPKVRVNAIAPSLTATPLASALIGNEARLQASIDRHPLKRIGSPENSSSLAAYLLSDQAGFITGQVIGVNGGMGSLSI